MLEVGDKAPGFVLEDDQGQPFDLGQQAGKKLLLVFYPGDDTPVCTKQLCDYRDGIEAFEGLGVEVVGISGDDGEIGEDTAAGIMAFLHGAYAQWALGGRVENMGQILLRQFHGIRDETADLQPAEGKNRK